VYGRPVRRLTLCCLCLLVLTAAVPGEAGAAKKGAPKDRVVITGPVTIARGEVAGDVVVLDGNVRVAGRVKGDLVVINGKTSISGSVKGDAVSIAKRMAVRKGARVGGDVRYADKKPVIAPGAKIGGKVKRVDAKKISSDIGAGAGIGLWLAMSVSTLLLGALLLLLLPRAAAAVHDAVTDRLGACFGWGLLLFFGLPILALILLVTVLGLPLGVTLLLALLPLAALAYTTSTWLVGRRILGPERNRFLAFLVGLVILRLLALVPVLGGLVWVLAVVFGLGALVLAASRAHSAARPPQRPPEAAAATP
jgi:cytoskeletal protein CcmA (bactofilin family)